MNPVTHFVVQTIERTLAAAAATGITVLGGSFINAYAIDYRTLLGDMGGTAIVTLLICLASQPFGDLSAASLVTPIPPVTKEPAPKADTPTPDAPSTSTVIQNPTPTPYTPTARPNNIFTQPTTPPANEQTM